MNWLVKVITLTEMIVGEQIDIKPQLVLAGQSPEKTNVWLQQMFKAATAGIDTSPYVARILGLDGGEEGEEQEDGAGDDDAEQRAAEEEEAQRQAHEAE